MMTSIFVKLFDNTTVPIDFEEGSANVDGVKRALLSLTGISCDEQRLLFAGRQLESGHELEDYGVEEDSTVHLSLRLLGGGKKRKKKQYTGPKKQKHVRKRQKLGVLKLYKIDDVNNKIIRQRVECNSTTCGAGIFMAKHKDRQYCGKCHATYTEKK